MLLRMRGAAIAAATVVVLGGCTPGGEPWDNTGYFEQERSRSAEQQKQLRDRVMHSQIDAQRPAHYIRGS